MGELCIESCAPEMKLREFEPDMTRSIDLLPRLTFREFKELYGRAKGEWLFVQQTKILEVLNGEDTGGNTYYSRRSRIPKTFKVEGLQDGTEGGNTAHKDREKCESKIE